MATRKVRLVKAYKIMGIHGFSRLVIRRPRGRVYEGIGAVQLEGITGDAVSDGGAGTLSC